MRLSDRMRNVRVVRNLWLHLPVFVRNIVRFFTAEIVTGELPKQAVPAIRPLFFNFAGGSVEKITHKQLESAPVIHDQLQSARLILHAAGAQETLHYYVDVWYGLCQAVDETLVLVVTRPALFDRLVEERPDVHAVLAQEALQTNWLIDHTPNLRAVLYVSNNGQNSHLARFNHLAHIFIGHGDSEKAGSCSKHFRLYDEVWTAGRAHIDRFRNAGFDYSSLRFRIVGRPMARSLLEQNGGGERRTFVYLPTWEGHERKQNYTSAVLLGSRLHEVASMTHLEGVAKFHPATGRRETSLANVEQSVLRDSTGKRVSADESQAEPAPGTVTVLDRSQPALELMAGAAFLVSDISSVVSDFLVTGRPIFLYVPEEVEIDMSSSSVPMSQYCYIYSQPEQLLRLVKRVIVDGKDDLRECRLEARDYFVDLNCTRNYQFERELRDLISWDANPTRSDEQ